MSCDCLLAAVCLLVFVFACVCNFFVWRLVAPHGLFAAVASCRVAVFCSAFEMICVGCAASLLFLDVFLAFVFFALITLASFLMALSLNLVLWFARCFDFFLPFACRLCFCSRWGSSCVLFVCSAGQCSCTARVFASNACCARVCGASCAE